MFIKKANVFTKDFIFDKKNIKIENGKITRIVDGDIDLEDDEVIDASDKMVIPGLCDIHFHGCVSYDFCDGSDEAISNMAKYQQSIGVMNICPATMTLSAERIKEICTVAGNYKASDDEAKLVGINLEGPFISPDRVGAQNPLYVQKADAKKLREWIDASNGLTKLITIAPEEEGALDCIKELKDEINFSVGHTMTDYETATKAYDLGARHMTHMFNAMPGFTHRLPGPIVAALEHKDVFVEMICDGVHIHPASIKTAFKMFGSDRVVLISDSTRACGMPDGEYELGGLPIFKKDGAARLKDGTLAGSSTNLFDCMKNVIKFGIPKEDAIKAATYNPCKAIGIDDRCGLIDEGRDAELLIIDNHFDLFKIIK